MGWEARFVFLGEVLKIFGGKFGLVVFGCVNFYDASIFS